MKTPQLTKRSDTPRTVQYCRMQAISLLASLLNQRWQDVMVWDSHFGDSGIGQSEGHYYARVDFEFHRGTASSFPVTVLTHYAFIFGYNQDPVAMETEIFIKHELAAEIRSTHRSRMGEGRALVFYADPVALEMAAIHQVNLAQDLQVFEWYLEGRLFARFYAYHRCETMILDMPSEKSHIFESIRPLLEETGIHFEKEYVGVSAGFERYTCHRSDCSVIWNRVLALINDGWDFPAKEVVIS